MERTDLGELEEPSLSSCRHEGIYDWFVFWMRLIKNITSIDLVLGDLEAVYMRTMK